MVSMDTFMLAKSMQANNKDAAEAYEAHIEQLNAIIEQQNSLILDLQTTVKAEQCAVAGIQAQLVAIEVENKNSKYLMPTNMTFANGERKTYGRAIYEVYFDKKAVEIGLENPIRYRRA
jgi:hypothetical protein